jgi:lysozyme
VLEIERMILRYEGFRANPYKCTGGKLTIGIGRNLEDKGITKSEAIFLLRSDIGECEADLFKIFGKDFFDLPDKRRWILIYMRFNLGLRGFCGFKKMIGAVKGKNFKKAANEMKKSLWYKQIGNKNKELVTMMREG